MFDRLRISPGGTNRMTPRETVEMTYGRVSTRRHSHHPWPAFPGCFWRQPVSVPWGGDSNGPAQVGAFFAKLNDVVETTGFEVEDNIEAPNQIVSYGYYTSRNRATNKTSRARFVFRWQFQNGKVARFEAVLDSAPIVAATQA